MRLWFSFLTLAMIIIVVGCTSYQISPSIQITTTQNPTLSNYVEQTADQDLPSLIRPSATFETTTPNPLILEMLEEVNIDNALYDLERLTGEEPICIDNECYNIKNRKTGSQGLRWAKKYVYQELVNLGYTVELQDWSNSEYSDQNIVAGKPGVVEPEEEIIFVAHLDGVDKAVLERFPAADDNASGVVDLLELARIIINHSFRRTVVLLFSTGEEQGRLGSWSNLSQLSPSEKNSIKYVVNIDVIGFDANNDHVMELWHGNHPASIELVYQISEIIQVYQLDLTPHLVVGCG